MGKKIFNVCLIIATVIMSIFTVVYGYVLISDKIPHSVTSAFVTTVTDPETNEQKPFVEARYYSNVNGKGYSVVELLFNAYSGISKQSIYARGFQLVYNEKGEIVINGSAIDEKDEYGDTIYNSHIFQYNKTNEGSFLTGHDYSWGDPMYVDINKKLYCIKLDGAYKTYTEGFDLGKSTGNFFKALFTDWGMFNQKSNWYTTTAYDHKYTFESLLIKVAEIVRSYSQGTGHYTIPLVDLGDFLHVYELDDNGNPSNEPIGYGGLINSYFTIDSYYTNSGMFWAKQSLFESVAGNSDFNISGLDFSVDYWKAAPQIYLTEQDFFERYSSVDGGFYYSLSQSKISELKNFDNAEIFINFNISNLKNKNVLGFDNYGLYGIKVKGLTISSDTSRQFNLLVGSLKDTGLSMQNIVTKNVTLNNLSSGVID